VLDALSPTQNLVLRPVPPNPGSGTTTILTRGDSVDRQPVISPDGTRVAFSSDREGNVDIWELDLESGGLRRLTTDPADDWDPAYTPDGRQLLWSSNRGGHYEVWIAASDGSGARQITADGVDAENPTMSADGRWITYASANPAQNGIWKIHPDGAGAALLVKGAMNNPEITADGTWVAFVDSESRRVRVVTVEEGNEVAALDLPSTNTTGGALGLTVGRARWIPKTRTLAWVDYDVGKRVTRLVSQDIAPGRDTVSSRRILVSGTFDDMPESFAFSPDGRKILISSIRDRSNILMIDGLSGVTR
jgi:TolB protein